MYSTCTITHAIITKQYARQFYGQYNRYYHQKEKKGKIWHLNGSFERQGPQRWFSHCNCLLPPSSTGMSHYPVFLHLIPPVLTIYHCPSVCAGSQACQILRVESIQHPLPLRIIPSFLLAQECWKCSHRSPPRARALRSAGWEAVR